MRQESGFTVTEETAGGECKIERSARWLPRKTTPELRVEEEDDEVPDLFDDDSGLVCFAGSLSVPRETDHGNLLRRTSPE